MRILIDGARLTNKPAGVIDITISIINALARNFPDYEIMVVSHNQLHREVAFQIESNPNVHIIIKKTILFQNIGLYWSIFKINSIIKQLKPDIFIAPNSLISPFFYPKNIKTLIFIHDLVYLMHPGSMSLITRIQMKTLQRYSVKRANYYWTNSTYTKDLLETSFSKEIRNKKIFTGSGINSRLINLAGTYELPNEKYSFMKCKYFLFVGTLEPRKNISFLLELFGQLKYRDHHLVIVGNKGWGKSERIIQKIINRENYPKNRVHFTGFVDLKDLVSIYKHALIFISTSINEGLGLPQLEAMALGIPVITPNNSAMKEVVSDAGITVKSWEFEDWNIAIEKMLSNREWYVNRGFKKISNYNWDFVISSFNKEILSLISES